MKTELEIKDKTVQTESIKIAPFRKNIRKTTPHKHNSYFEIIYLGKGSGSHTIDTKEYEINTPIIFTVRKEQVHFWDIQSDPEGFVIIIKKSFMENCLDKDIKGLISELSSYSCLYPNDDAATTFFNLLLEQHQENSPFKRPIIDGLLKALLGKLLESTAHSFSRNGNNSIYKQFLELLSQDEKLKNSVAYYAQYLNTTPQNLNAVCRKEVQQSATEILSEHIVNEAKRLLLYTDLTVSQISGQLNFKDNSHFSKYFKYHVDKTPIEFRKEHS